MSGSHILEATTEQYGKQIEKLREEVERLKKAFDAALTQRRIAVEESNELHEEVERLKAKLDRSHLYRNSSYWQEKAMAVLRGEFTQCCSYCGFEAQPPNGWEELQKHIEECPEHPLPKLRARVEELEGRVKMVKGWFKDNAYENQENYPAKWGDLEQILEDK